jgi:hypothetical protein
MQTADRKLVLPSIFTCTTEEVNHSYNALSLSAVYRYIPVHRKISPARKSTRYQNKYEKGENVKEMEAIMW